MASRKGESGGAISTMRKLVLFVVITAILVVLAVILKDKILENFETLFHLSIFGA